MSDRVDKPADYQNEPRRVIAELPPRDGMLWEAQCARCGSSYGHDDFYGDSCLSSAKWCEAHPLPDREHIKRGEIEWYQVAEL